MTIGEIYDKIEMIDNLKSEREAYLRAYCDKREVTQEDLKHFLEHGNFVEPKTDTDLHKYYDGINKCNESIRKIREESVCVDRNDAEDNF